jgi:2-methylisocitrate lyase-like PEP mutase family enzyme
LDLLKNLWTSRRKYSGNCEVRKTEALKALASGSQIIITPGVFDTLSAMISEQAGFRSVPVTGYGASGTMLGEPDFGLKKYTAEGSHYQRKERGHA